MGDKDLFAPGEALKKFFNIEETSTVIIAVFFTFSYLLLLRLQLIYGYLSPDDFVYLAYPEALSSIFVQSTRLIPAAFARISTRPKASSSNTISLPNERACCFTNCCACFNEIILC